jgi:hypothetical protein
MLQANNIQQLVPSALAGVTESDASTQTEAHIQQLFSTNFFYAYPRIADTDMGVW